MFIVDLGEAFNAQRLGQLQKLRNLILVDIHFARVHKGDERRQR